MEHFISNNTNYLENEQKKYYTNYFNSEQCSDQSIYKKDLLYKISNNTLTIYLNFFDEKRNLIDQHSIINSLITIIKKTFPTNIDMTNKSKYSHILYTLEIGHFHRTEYERFYYSLNFSIGNLIFIILETYKNTIICLSINNLIINKYLNVIIKIINQYKNIKELRLSNIKSSNKTLSYLLKVFSKNNPISIYIDNISKTKYLVGNKREFYIFKFIKTNQETLRAIYINNDYCNNFKKLSYKKYCNGLDLSLDSLYWNVNSAKKFKLMIHFINKSKITMRELTIHIKFNSKHIILLIMRLMTTISYCKDLNILILSINFNYNYPKIENTVISNAVNILTKLESLEYLSTNFLNKQLREDNFKFINNELSKITFPPNLIELNIESSLRLDNQLVKTIKKMKQLKTIMLPIYFEYSALRKFLLFLIDSKLTIVHINLSQMSNEHIKILNYIYEMLRHNHNFHQIIIKRFIIRDNALKRFYCNLNKIKRFTYSVDNNEYYEYFYRKRIILIICQQID